MSMAIDLRDYINRQRQILTEGIELMRAGAFKTGDLSPGGLIKDTTADTIQLYEELLGRLEDTEKMTHSD